MVVVVVESYRRSAAHSMGGRGETEKGRGEEDAHGHKQRPLARTCGNKSLEVTQMRTCTLTYTHAREHAGSLVADLTPLPRLFLLYFLAHQRRDGGAQAGHHVDVRPR